MTELISIKNLHIKRGGKAVLHVDQLSIMQGEVLAVVGPNGAGKSTLLLTLARLLKPEHGDVIFSGEKAEDMSDTVYRRRIGLVLQDPLLFDTSVFENVASGLKFRGVEKDEIKPRVELWLERLGVVHLSKRRAGQLSGGEAQRISLARALVLEPELLLLDEPFSALDPPTRARILDDLKRLLAKVHTTTVFVTHDLPEAKQLAERMAVIIGNRLRQVGDSATVFSNPTDTEVAQFLNHRNGY